MTCGLPWPFEPALDLAEQEAPLLLLRLVVAGAVLGDDVGVGGEHFVDDRGDRAFVAHLREPALLDDVARPLVLAQRFVEHVLGLRREIVPSATRSTSSASISGVEHRGRRARVSLRYASTSWRTQLTTSFGVPAFSAATAVSA